MVKQNNIPSVTAAIKLAGQGLVSLKTTRKIAKDDLLHPEWQWLKEQYAACDGSGVAKAICSILNAFFHQRRLVACWTRDGVQVLTKNDKNHAESSAFDNGQWPAIKSILFKTFVEKIQAGEGRRPDVIRLQNEYLRGWLTVDEAAQEQETLAFARREKVVVACPPVKDIPRQLAPQAPDKPTANGEPAGNQSKEPAGNQLGNQAPDKPATAGKLKTPPGKIIFNGEVFDISDEDFLEKVNECLRDNVKNMEHLRQWTNDVANMPARLRRRAYALISSREAELATPVEAPPPAMTADDYNDQIHHAGGDLPRLYLLRSLLKEDTALAPDLVAHFTAWVDSLLRQAGGE